MDTPLPHMAAGVPRDLGLTDGPDGPLPDAAHRELGRTTTVRRLPGPAVRRVRRLPQRRLGSGVTLPGRRPDPGRSRLRARSPRGRAAGPGGQGRGDRLRPRHQTVEPVRTERAALPGRGSVPSGPRRDALVGGDPLAPGWLDTMDAVLRLWGRHSRWALCEGRSSGRSGPVGHRPRRHGAASRAGPRGDASVATSWEALRCRRDGGSAERPGAACGDPHSAEAPVRRGGPSHRRAHPGPELRPLLRHQASSGGGGRSGRIGEDHAGAPGSQAPGGVREANPSDMFQLEVGRVPS